MNLRRTIEVDAHNENTTSTDVSKLTFLLRMKNYAEISIHIPNNKNGATLENSPFRLAPEKIHF